MKTIIAIVLFAVTVQAQPRKLDPDSVNQSLGEMIYRGQLLDMERAEQSNVAHALLSLYDRYETDCYNDSTLTEGAWFRNYDTWKEFWAPYTPRGGEYMANLVRRESRWLHREATFKGFIQWVREEFVAREGQTKGRP